MINNRSTENLESQMLRNHRTPWQPISGKITPKHGHQNGVAGCHNYVPELNFSGQAIDIHDN